MRSLREVKNMYETVKIINGIAITRLIGSRGVYHVTVAGGDGWKAERTFKTIKAAVEFIVSSL